jgi:hypothetical protein
MNLSAEGSVIELKFVMFLGLFTFSVGKADEELQMKSIDM